MERYVDFPGLGALPSVFFFKSWSTGYKNDVLRIEDRGSLLFRDVSVSFRRYPLAVRHLSHLSQTTSEVHSYRHLPESGISLVENSKYVEWFQEQSRGVYAPDYIYHVVVVLSDGLFEFLCLELPEVAWF
ncbi:hypothetical protein FRC91_14090 [Bradymonadales bacterium TMQ1]|nr:hypothetical protein FRC91_14090 [Bradymonadales bacterium TMQ1]